MKRIFVSLLLITILFSANAQQKDSVNPRPITITEYNKAKGFSIKDLDKDSYAKFENNYILDRYEMRKPYFITGDDGVKKRIDLYKLVAKEGMQELGTMIFYTNEKGKLYTALQPNFTADAKVWENYFEDIHSIEKEEKNFVLKLSYILSKEMSFQLFKSINKGKDMKSESATYGTDICFPGDQLVAMADGSKKNLAFIHAGDKVLSVDPLSKKQVPVIVTRLAQHEAKNYAVVKLLLVSAKEKKTAKGVEVHLASKALAATPNHPMLTATNRKRAGELSIGDEVLCANGKTKGYTMYTVYNRSESAAGIQKVYNMETSSGSTFIMNGVMVLQK